MFFVNVTSTTWIYTYLHTHALHETLPSLSGIAEVMHNLGYSVQGSDINEGYVIEGLRAKGIPVHVGHKAENLGDSAVVVTSTAIKRGNPEVEARSEEHTSELQSLMRISYAVFCLQKKTKTHNTI